MPTIFPLSHKVFYTGNYLLNTLVFPILYIQLLLTGAPLSLPNFFDVGKETTQLVGVSSLKFNNFLVIQ